MSWLQKTKSSSRRCSRFSSELDSRLSMQMTRNPLPSRYSQRWEPRNPAPPVTTAVGILGMLAGVFAGTRRLLRTPNGRFPAPLRRPEQENHGRVRGPEQAQERGRGATQQAHREAQVLELPVDAHRGNRHFLVPEARLSEEALRPAARREKAVVVGSAASGTHVGVGEAARDPAQERQAEMRLDQ